MKDPILWRLLWKEYRTQRGFWLAVAGTAVLIQLLVVGTFDPDDVLAIGLFALASVLPAFYALGCGAVSFAIEREEGTSELLCRLAPPGRVLVSKLGFGLASTLAMFALLQLSTWGLASNQLPALSELGYSWNWMRTWSLVSLELLAWGILFSLLTSRPLNATCLAAVAMPASLALYFMFLDPTDELPGESLRLLFAIGILAIDARLSWHWVKNGGQIHLMRFLHRFRTQKEVACAETAFAESGRNRLTESARKPGRISKSPLRSLLWKEWRQARKPTIILLGCLVVLSIYELSFPNNFLTFLILALLFSVVGSVLAGTQAFAGEKEGRRFRFLTERGVSPQAVWLVKQLIWFPIALATALPNLLDIFTTQEIGGDSPMPTAYELSVAAWQLLLVVGLYYGAGQLLSMLIPRTVPAVFLGLVLATILVLWAGIMDKWIVPLYWSVAPLPLILLAATLVRAPGWMLERRTWRAWLPLVATILVPGAVLLVAVPVYRLAEIPDHGPGFDVDEFLRPLTPEEVETAEMYRQASNLLRGSWMEVDTNDEEDWQPIIQAENDRHTQNEQLQIEKKPNLTAKDGWLHATPQEIEWLTDNQEPLRITLKATERAACGFDEPTRIKMFDDSNIPDGIMNRYLVQLLLLSARQFESEGNLNEALERYLAALRLARHVAMHGGSLAWVIGSSTETEVYRWMPLWASHPRQTSEGLATIIRQLEKQATAFPPFTEAIKMEYVVARHILEGDWTENELAPKDIWSDVNQHQFFWERTRELRVWDSLTAEVLNRARRTEHSLDWPNTDLSVLDAEFGPNDDQLDTPPWKWLKNTPLCAIFFLSLTGAGQEQRPVDLETRRRALRITLALFGWKKENGQLPDRLDELVGKYFDRLPLDPWSGREFGYRRDGFPTPIRFGEPDGFIATPGEPLLWSAGAGRGRIIQVGVTKNGALRYAVCDRYGKMLDDIDHKGYSSSEDIGWAFRLTR